MPRLFVALDLPRVITRRLEKIRPPAMRGIRLVPAEQMHVTVHFIGDAEIEPVSSALKTIEHQVFTISIENIGRFKIADGGAIVWAGIQPNPDLADLYALLGKTLASVGFKPEKRSYKPHITLARCSAAAAQSILPNYLGTNTELLMPNIPVIKFALYSSTLTPTGPEYHVEGRYPLKA